VGCRAELLSGALQLIRHRIRGRLAQVSQYEGCYMTGDKNIIDNGYGCEWFKALFSPDVYS
jgi:hypothetical protein